MGDFFKKLRFGFEIHGLCLFLLIMLPNLIWFAVPAPKDVLRAGSAVPGWDMAGSVFQVLLFTFLCLLQNQSAGKLKERKRSLFGSVICCLCYCFLWALYYLGIASPAVLLGLCLAPCGAFLFFAWNRKNGPAFFAAALFTLCHFVTTLCNFIL